MKRQAMACIVTTVFLAAVGSASADMSFTWSTGGVNMDNLGNDGSGSPGYDYVHVFGTPDSPMTLVPGVPQIVAVNSLVFGVGFTGAGTAGPHPYSLERDLTIDGVTKTLANPITLVVDQYVDSLYVGEGPSVTFGEVVVTPLGWGTDYLASDGSTTPGGVLMAKFELVASVVPAPGAALLGLLGGGLAMWAKRRVA